jgi:hypothetical protein
VSAALQYARQFLREPGAVELVHMNDILRTNASTLSLSLDGVSVWRGPAVRRKEMQAATLFGSEDLGLSTRPFSTFCASNGSHGNRVIITPYRAIPTAAIRYH